METSASMRDRLRIVPQFRPDEYERVRDIAFPKLGRRLSRWEPHQVELELSMKGRGTPQQRTVIECWLPKVPKLVATSTKQEVDQAVVEVRDDLLRQVDRHLTRKESARRR